jgi:hypothetical protein
MMRFVAVCLVGALLLPASGCGGPDTGMREALAHLSAYTEAIEKKESPERQAATRQRFEAAAEKINKLPADRKDQLLKRYQADIARARERLDAALKNRVLEGDPLPPNPLDTFLK